LPRSKKLKLVERLAQAVRRLRGTPARWRDARDNELARGERGVDQAWYLATYPDVAAAGVDPVRHYLEHGWIEGRDPRADFSTRAYLAAHDDVARVRKNPLIYYLRQGGGPQVPRDAADSISSDDELARGEGGVDQVWYLAAYPDVAAAGHDPVSHYLDHGWREGRDPRRDFSTRGYLEIRQDVALSGLNPFVHYLRHGGPRGPLRASAPSSWHMLSYGFGRVARHTEWWDYKLVPILSIFYATALMEGVAIVSLWPTLVVLVAAIAPGAAWVSVLNDVTDRAEDRRAGKPNRLADKPLGLLALLLAVPPGIGVVFSVLWRDDPPLVASYLAAWAAFTLYSVPPFRFKHRGLLGIFADAAGAHLCPALVATFLCIRAAGGQTDPLWVGAVGAWAFACGVRGILWHQVADLENDRKAGVQTFTVRHSLRAARYLAVCVALPVEMIALAVMLWRMPSAWPARGLLVYTVFATLRWRLWRTTLAVVQQRERSAIVAHEYYGVLFPLCILIASALRHPLDAAVLAAHLLAFPAPALTLARQTRWLLRDLVQSRR
jgi:4-hydroxybenzoate polyprenyltransferase